MSTQSAENYLDELLNSVNPEHSKAVLTEENAVAEEDIQFDIQPESQPQNNDVVRNTAKAEAEFLMEFEKELAGDDYEDFLKDFEDNNILPEDRLAEEDMIFTEEDALLSMLGGDFADGADEVQSAEPEAALDNDDFSLEELALSGVEIEEILAGDASMEEPDLSADAPVKQDEVIDLSQMGEEDLISLLAGADDLSDIGQLFSQNDNNLPIEGEDPFAAFAESEMSANEEELDVVKQDAKPAKKVGFLEKLTNLLFGKEVVEEEKKPEAVSITADDLPGVVELSDENADILAMFSDAGSLDPVEKEEPKKGKAKKEKKKKEAKPKTPKKPKAPKPKKEKKPKEKDNTPPLPKGPVVLVVLLAASIFVLVFFGTDLLGYDSALTKAKDLYKHGQYSQAAEAIAGITIKEEDMMIEGKINTLAAVHSQYQEYLTFMKYDRKAEALDSLICAAGRIVVNEENTLTFDCSSEMDNLKDHITRELAEFSVTYQEALDLYSLNNRDRAEYTRELYKLYEKLGIEVE